MTGPLAPAALATPYVNPRSVALLNRAPYLTVSEYQFAPTALDLNDLVNNGNGQSQETSLAQIIDRASSMIDQHCFPSGTGGTLSASVDTDTGRPFVRQGWARLVCRYKPVLEVRAVSIGSVPSQLAGLSLGAQAQLWVQDRVINVPAFTDASLAFVGTNSLFGPTALGSGRVFASWSYVNGYPHGTLAAACTQGGSTVELTASPGVYPGTTLQIYDGENSEAVAVESQTTSGTTTTVTTAEPLQYSHTPPAGPDAVSVSALPPAVKQAAIFYTSALIKARGTDALEWDDMTSEPQIRRQAPKSIVSDLDLAKDCLAQFRIVAPAA